MTEVAIRNYILNFFDLFEGRKRERERGERERYCEGGRKSERGRKGG